MAFFVQGSPTQLLQVFQLLQACLVLGFVTDAIRGYQKPFDRSETASGKDSALSKNTAQKTGRYVPADSQISKLSQNGGRYEHCTVDFIEALEMRLASFVQLVALLANIILAGINNIFSGASTTFGTASALMVFVMEVRAWTLARRYDSGRKMQFSCVVDRCLVAVKDCKRRV